MARSLKGNDRLQALLPRPLRILNRWLLCLLLSSPLSAQPRVYRDTVQPHWLSNGRAFWYRNDLPGGRREFLWVDAVAGVRRPAFDHRRLAALLARQSGQAVDPERLPFYGLLYDQPGQVLLCGPRFWRLRLSSYELVEAFEQLEPLPVLREVGFYATRPVPTRIVFVNRTPGEVQLNWYDAENAAQKHSRLAAGASQNQPTFDGQYWTVEDVATGGRLAVFQAIDCPAQAVIDAPPPPDPRVSPDRTRAVVVRDHNLWLRGDGPERPLTQDGKAGDDYAATDLCWSPDSRWLLALRTRRGPVKTPPDYPRPGDELDRPAPQLFEVASGQQTSLSDRLFPNPLALHTLRWAADSSRVTFVYQERGHRVLRLLSADAATGQVRCLIEDTYPTFVCDSQKYFCEWLGDDEVVWMSERSGYNHLWLFDAHSGQPKRAVTSGEWAVQGVVAVDERNRQVYFLAGAGNEPYCRQFCRADLDRDEVRVLTHEDADHRVQLSPTGQFLVDTWSRPDRLPVTDLLTGRVGDKVCRLEQAVAGELGRVRLPQPFVAKGRDGVTDIYGLVYFPRDFSLSRKYPVVEHVYAGPQQFSTPKDFRAVSEPDQALADRGLIVVQCDGMGTPGRSKGFHDVCYKNLRDAGFPDRVVWIRSAARRFPQMDLTRVGIYGSSAGGANAVAALIWHNDFYKVAAADCGNHDLRLDNLYWSEQWMGWPVGPEYAENSNQTYADRVQGKLLLLVGDQDEKVDPASTLNLSHALNSAGKSHELVVLKGVGHCASATPEGWRRLSDFLVHHLGAE